MITMLSAVKTESLILLALCFGIQLEQLLISPLQQLMKVMKTLKELEKWKDPNGFGLSCRVNTVEFRFNLNFEFLFFFKLRRLVVSLR